MILVQRIMSFLIFVLSQFALLLASTPPVGSFLFTPRRAYTLQVGPKTSYLRRCPTIIAITLARTISRTKGGRTNEVGLCMRYSFPSARGGLQDLGLTQSCSVCSPHLTPAPSTTAFSLFNSPTHTLSLTFHISRIGIGNTLLSDSIVS